MTVNYTALLGLAKPVEGTEDDAWGAIVNDRITQLIEDAVSGIVTVSVLLGDVTLTSNTGQTNQARMAIIVATGTPGVARNIIAPSSSKIYQLINQSDSTVTLKGAATTGVTVPAGASATIAWNGSDFVEITKVSSGKTIRGNLSIEGNTTIPAGTAAAPSISPTGDTNTGVYFPAADQVAISTGGTQRVVVNNAGHVGIGTSTPGDAFTLALGNARIQRDVPQLLFRSPGNVNQSYIGANISDSTNGGLHFGLGSGIGAGTTYMRIDSIGRLHVNSRANFGSYGGEYQGIRLTNNDDSSVAETVSFIDTVNNLSAVDSSIYFGHKVNGGSFLAFVSTPPGDRNTDRRIERLRIDELGATRPSTDNAYTLGNASNRWNVVYAATGTINTSDERAKLDFADTLGLDFILKLEPVSYRYKNGKTAIDQVEDGVEEVPAVLDEDGNEVTPATTSPKYKHVERIEEGKRRHHGLKAQQVKQTLDQLGVDFAGWILTDLENSDSEQGLRYDQFIAPLIKSIKEQQALIESLTARIAVLEAK